MARRKQTLMWALYALFFLAVLILQDTVLARLQPFGAPFCIVPVAALCVAMQQGGEKGGIFCLGAGLLLALSGTSDGGLWIFFLVLAGALCGWLCAAVFLPRLLPTTVLCLLSLTVILAVISLIHIYLEGLHFQTVFRIFRQVASAVPFAPVFYWCAKAVGKVGV